MASAAPNAVQHAWLNPGKHGAVAAAESSLLNTTSPFVNDSGHTVTLPLTPAPSNPSAKKLTWPLAFPPAV
jgi:hypothetical protein